MSRRDMKIISWMLIWVGVAIVMSHVWDPEWPQMERAVAAFLGCCFIAVGGVLKGKP